MRSGLVTNPPYGLRFSIPLPFTFLIPSVICVFDSVFHLRF